MTVSLTQPAEGSVGWAAAINQNFQDIEDALATTGGTFADGVTCLSAQTQTIGPSLTYTVTSGMLANDGESLRIYASGSSTAVGLSVFGTDVLATTPGGHWTLHAVVTRESSTQVRVSILGGAPATVGLLTGSIAVTCSGGVVSDLKVELIAQSPYTAGNAVLPVVPGTVAVGVSAMPPCEIAVGTSAPTAGTLVSGAVSVLETVEASAASPVHPIGNVVYHSGHGYVYCLRQKSSTTIQLYRRAIDSTTWTTAGSAITVSSSYDHGALHVVGDYVMWWYYSGAVYFGRCDSSGTVSLSASSGIGITATSTTAMGQPTVVHQGALVLLGRNTGAGIYTISCSTSLVISLLNFSATQESGLCSWQGRLFALIGGTTLSELVSGSWTTRYTWSASYDLSYGVVGIGGHLYVAINNNLYEIDGSTWSLVSTTAFPGTAQRVSMIVDDVTDPTAPTLSIYYNNGSDSGAWSWWCPATGATATLAYNPTDISLPPSGALSEGRVVPRADDTACLASLAPALVAGQMTLSATITCPSATDDTWTCELWVDVGRVGAWARATLVGTATGGTRAGSQVTGVAHATSMSVNWDMAADSVADGVLIYYDVRRYRE